MLAACAMAFACVKPETPEPKPEPEEPVEPSVEVAVSAAEMLSAEFTLKTEALVEYAYISVSYTHLRAHET